MSNTLKYSLNHDYDQMLSHMRPFTSIIFDIPEGFTFYISKIQSKVDRRRYTYCIKVMQDNLIEYISVGSKKDVVNKMLEYTI